MIDSPYRESLAPIVDEVTRHVVSAELGGDEKILWLGRPMQGVVMSDPTRTIMGVPFTAFALFWESLALRGHAPSLFALWGLPFIGAGLYNLVGRLFYDAWLRARTYYALTDKRALIVVQRSTRQVTSIDLRDPRELAFEERADGTGTITFAPKLDAVSGSRVPQPPRFFRIDRARAVFALLNEQKQLPR